MTKKGLYKLATRPHIFFKDYVAKKQRKFEYLIPKKKVIGEYQYTVVSAVYGVEKYLDDYFKSLINQTLKFEEHIFLVLVDDGSLDNSAQIIKKWQKKYPNNIAYVKKKNGGQASARNVGLNYVNTEWVTFIDPDDFVDLNYFKEVDNFLYEHSDVNLSMLSCNFIFFYEKREQYKDTHPLKYRFRKYNKIVSVDTMNGLIQLSVNSAFFKKTIIQNNSIFFHEEIRPSFEDAHFVGRYLLHAEDTSIAFIKDAKYFYRKREASNSTLDTGWQKQTAFSEVLELGCLSLFNESIKLNGFVSKELQKTVLYHLIWHFKKIVNNSASVAFLSVEQKEIYKNLLKNIFNYIDVDTINNFDLGGFWFYHKVALIGIYKKETLEQQIVYIEEYDEAKNELKVRYFSYFDNFSMFTINNQDILPTYSKIRKHDFIDELFVNEYIVWIPLSEIGLFNTYINNNQAIIGFKGNHWKSGVDIEIIKNHFIYKKLNNSKFPLSVRIKRRLYQSSYYKNKYKNAWLLMDRDIQSDDNAEHLYRYILKNHSDINAYFVLRKSSHDWDRLRKEGFRLIDFGSIEHEALLVNAIHIISSHADTYIMNYLPQKFYRDILNFKYTFLQHGVTQNDISNWFNSKNISALVTISKDEYSSIVEDGTKYKFTKKEVVLTGFPRHDTLLKNKNLKEKIILIMPTWRQSLVGKTVGKGNIREKNREFSKTDYAIAWSSILKSNQLESMIKKYQYRVIFFPHVNIEPYLDEFDIPSYIETLSHHQGSIQRLFQKASLLITDYSSVAFEMGALYREVIYYQFDYDEIFGGKHITEKGYFDYVDNGFGEVCYKEEEVLNTLEQFFKQLGKVNEKYLNRMKNFFAYHDTNNCKRVFQAITNLYSPNIEEISNELLLRYAEDALKYKVWKAVESRYELLRQRGIEVENIELILSQSKLALGRVDDARKLLDSYTKKYGNSNQTDEIYQNIDRTQILLDSLTKKERLLLVNEKEDFSLTLTYKNIIQWFKNKKWRLLNIVTKLIDKRFILKKDLSYFYYICLITANEIDSDEDRLFYSPLVRNYL